MLDLECPPELRAAARAALETRAVEDGHLTVELVDEARIRELNRVHRGVDAPTDVLSFPVDGAGPAACTTAGAVVAGAGIAAPSSTTPFAPSTVTISPSRRTVVALRVATTVGR